MSRRRRADFDYWIIDVKLPSTGEVVRSRLPDCIRERPEDGSPYETHGEIGVVVGAKKHCYDVLGKLLIPGGRPTGQEV